MSKKTVLIVTFPQGGPFVWAQNLARELRKGDFEVTVVSGRKEYVKQQFKYYDIVHSCVPMPNLLCKRFVLTIHGNFREEKMIARPFFWLMIKRADYLTAPSAFLKNALGLKKTQIIPNGIDLPKDTKKIYKLLDGSSAVGVLTNFNFRPKTDGLLHLAKIVQKISPEIKLVIGGSGKFFEEYKQKVLGIHANADFLGHCQKEDLFRQIDVFAYYSLLDNQPLALLEAMAAGLPVMSNVVGSVEEVLTGKIEQYIARTDEDYSKKLESLLESEAIRRENGQEARERAKDFSWKKIVDEFIKLYNK